MVLLVGAEIGGLCPRLPSVLAGLSTLPGWGFEALLHAPGTAADRRPEGRNAQGQHLLALLGSRNCNCSYCNKPVLFLAGRQSLSPRAGSPHAMMWL